ncbi:hypothetical protein [Polaromonas sp. AET17H-212]|uniref:hypothetical protein n=1 Tax=Polaromonas sp. AET17H-212 TaxID=1977061 RepID=UPI001C3F0491|nr:hypothetical protein [Polaromonas sp. AET17H-212]
MTAVNPRSAHPTSSRRSNSPVVVAGLSYLVPTQLAPCSYASLARDLAAGTYYTPGFHHAVHNSRLVAAVERATQTGERQRNLN